jgi:hypothetical protein
MIYEAQTPEYDSDMLNIITHVIVVSVSQTCLLSEMFLLDYYCSYTMIVVYIYLFSEIMEKTRPIILTVSMLHGTDVCFLMLQGAP